MNYAQKYPTAKKGPFAGLRVDRIMRALDNWTPYGLCSGRVLKANGEPSNTVGCWLGALAMEVLDKSKDRSLREQVAEVLIRDEAISLSNDVSENDLELPVDLAALAEGYYGTSVGTLNAGIDVNDNMLVDAGVSPTVLPRIVRRKIVALRRKFNRLAVRHKLPKLYSPDEEDNNGEDDGEGW